MRTRKMGPTIRYMQARRAAITRAQARDAMLLKLTWVIGSIAIASITLGSLIYRMGF